MDPKRQHINNKLWPEDKSRQKMPLFFCKSQCPSSNDLANKRRAMMHEEIKQLTQSKLAKNDYP